MLADATQLSILVDGYGGYGNFNNVRRLVRKLFERHVTGVCIEDKLCSKTNSFISGKRRQNRQRLLAQHKGGMARWMCNARSIVVRSSARGRFGTWGSSASTG